MKIITEDIYILPKLTYNIRKSLHEYDNFNFEDCNDEVSMQKYIRIKF